VGTRLLRNDFKLDLNVHTREKQKFLCGSAKESNWGGNHRMTGQGGEVSSSTPSGDDLIMEEA
jgi:hypothetical protein